MDLQGKLAERASQNIGKLLPYHLATPACCMCSGRIIAQICLNAQRWHKKRAGLRPARITLFLGSANAANGGAAVRAFALRDRLAVLRRALDGVDHDLLRLALDAICLNRHFRPQSFFSGSDPIPTLRATAIANAPFAPACNAQRLYSTFAAELRKHRTSKCS